jgi:hypothetical protein
MQLDAECITALQGQKLDAAAADLLTDSCAVLARAVLCCRFAWSAHGLQLSSAWVVFLHQ